MKSLIKMKRFSIYILLLFSLGIVTSDLSAQYFGRNKVMYENFDFQVMKTEHFDIYFYSEMKEAALHAARMAERWYERLARMFNYDLRGRQPLILYSSSPHFQQTSVIPQAIGEGVGGVTEAIKRRIILPMGPSLKDSDHVIGHELVHAFQYDISAKSNTSFGRITSPTQQLPLWLIEGLAEYLSIGPQDAHTAMWMRDSIR
ncbi:hypothetical protein ACFLRM_04745 [Acidobacteriota bacterium]